MHYPPTNYSELASPDGATPFDSDYRKLHNLHFHQVDIDRTITVALIQYLTYRINNRLIINIRRPNSWLFRSARQFVRVNKLSGF